MYKLLFRLIFLVFFLVLFFESCKPKEKIAPGFPPSESLTIDLSYFDQNSVADSYFYLARHLLDDWKSTVNDSLHFYRTIYTQIVSEQLDHQTENTWLIRFENNFETETDYDIKYFEIVDADTIYSKLFASYIINYHEKDTTTEVLFMDGEMTDYETGLWTINLADTVINKQIKYLTIDWKVTPTGKNEVKITNHREGGENGDFIFYKDSIDDVYSSYLSLYYKAEDSYITIEWNSVTKKGRIKDFNINADDKWYCWDENLSDTDCN